MKPAYTRFLKSYLEFIPIEQKDQFVRDLCIMLKEVQAKTYEQAERTAHDFPRGEGG